MNTQAQQSSQQLSTNDSSQHQSAQSAHNNAKHKTFKKSQTDSSTNLQQLPYSSGEEPASLRAILEDSALQAYSRPWHRLERGLRLNRLRLFVEEFGSAHALNPSEKELFFKYLQKALDKNQLNTHKIVNYRPEINKIIGIIGLEIRRSADGTARWGFNAKKKIETKKKKKDDSDIAKIE
jgi:hypothetical protein